MAEELMEIDHELLELGIETAKIMQGRWFWMMTPEEAREAFLRLHAAQESYVLDDELLAVSVQDTEFDFEGKPIKLKIYKPANLDRAPVIMYYHGGGWVFGDVDSYDATTRMICALTGCVVVSVDYLLAPENKFPAPVKSAFAAIEWAIEHIDELGGYADSIVLAGDSAGGNITGATALYAANHGVELGGQAILYGVLCHMDYSTKVGVTEWEKKDCASARRSSRRVGTGATTSKTKRTAPIRSRPRCWPRTSVMWPRPSSRPACSTPSTRTASPTVSGCGPPACRRWCSSGRTLATASCRTAGCRPGIAARSRGPRPSLLSRG